MSLSQTKMLTSHNKIELHLLNHTELDFSCENDRGTITLSSGGAPFSWHSSVGLDFQRVVVERAQCALMTSNLPCSVPCGAYGGTAQPIE